MTAARSGLSPIKVTSRPLPPIWLDAHHATSHSVWLVRWKKQDPVLHLLHEPIGARIWLVQQSAAQPARPL